MIKWFKKNKNKTKTFTEEPIKEVPGYCDVKFAVAEDGRIKIKLDWDDVFINELRKRGYKGSEDQIAQQVLAYYGQKIADEALVSEDDENSSSEYT